MNRTPDRPIVYCISEGRAGGRNFNEEKRAIVGRIRNAGRCGVTMFQVREKALTGSHLMELAVEAVEAAREAGVKLLINGRADIAFASGADGIHLPSDGVPVRELRAAVPTEFLIAVSTHSVDEAEAARDGGADLITFGPVFSSPGKGDGVGPDELAKVCRRLGDFPVVALGGVDECKIDTVLGNGAAGFAAIRFLNECLSTGRPAADRAPWKLCPIKKSV